MIQINIGALEGIIAIAAILVGGRVAWGTVKSDLSTIKRVLLDEIKPDLKELHKRLTIAEERVEIMWHREIK